MSQNQKVTTTTCVETKMVNGVVVENVTKTCESTDANKESIPKNFKQLINSEPIDKPKRSIEGSPEEQKKELERSALEAHNRYRAKHGVPDLTLAEDLCEMAQKWADYLASRNVPQHSDCKGVGENLANNWRYDGGLLTGEEATDIWYEEIKKYDFNDPTFRSGTGHFTQVVWKESKEMGIGRGRSEDGSYFVVANYRPAGNFMGHFAENVFRPKA
ncbi:Golgi-associated plant pathogenesis-related protein 1 [Octopus bimaculoides]|uniref:Golgi-associated plant pathogenesis-related protein 1 n=1 Tax=Octopus bimaculoides TaxID=37653 RepID=UPI0022E4344D|nr:Golgi-associated plant pathogenesis-related protein 1 [Octopus bimaculoides]